MPTLLTAFGLRFFWVMYDLLHEPCHIHVTDKNRKVCKFWIFENGVFEIADNKG